MQFLRDQLHLSTPVTYCLPILILTIQFRYFAIDFEIKVATAWKSGLVNIFYTNIYTQIFFANLVVVPQREKFCLIQMWRHLFLTKILVT